MKKKKKLSQNAIKNSETEEEERGKNVGEKPKQILNVNKFSD